ncbi:hypothetical protein JW998_12680 [candidate division KSB1 bacterium]|nr:hypothetical protein [candidate division KSB1 bacterium]
MQRGLAGNSGFLTHSANRILPLLQDPVTFILVYFLDFYPVQLKYQLHDASGYKNDLRVSAALLKNIQKQRALT